MAPRSWAKYVLFDLDDTLIDRGSWNEEQIQNTARSFGVDIPLDKVLLAPCYRRLLQEYGLGWDEFWTRFDLGGFDDRERGMDLGRIKVYPDALESICMLREYKIAIVSNTPRMKSEKQVRRFGIDALIPHRYNYELGGKCRAKPEVDLGVLALDELGMDQTKRSVIFVMGDHHPDMGLARNLKARYPVAQVQFVYVKRRPLEGIVADFTVEGDTALMQAAKIILDWDGS